MTERFYIYRKDGSKIKVGGTNDAPEYLSVEELQLDDTFLGQKQVTLTIKSPIPITFEGQEYIELDGDIFTLKYDPSLKKQDNAYKYGESYLYQDIIFQSTTDELTRVMFLDYVLQDNLIHYSAMSTVYFFGTVKDLAMRIQANLDRVYTDDKKWTVVLADNLSTKEKQKTYENVHVWDAVTDLWNEFKTLFYVKGRTLYVGETPDTVAHEFLFGRGNGLKSIEKKADENNEIITRLHAYGSQKNLPYRYYNTIGQLVKDEISVELLFIATNQGDDKGEWTNENAFLVKDAPVSFFKNDDNIFKLTGTVHYAETGDDTRTITITARKGNAPWNAYNPITHGNEASVPCLLFSCQNYEEYRWLHFLTSNARKYFTATFTSTNNVNIKYAPLSWLDPKSNLVSESMYLPNLMLPAIRIRGNATKYYDKALKEVTDKKDAAYEMVKTGFGGKDLDIYIQSIDGIDHFGVLEGNVIFDNDKGTDFEDLVDDENGIYPTLSQAPNEENKIVSATQITDSGVFDNNGQITPATFEVVVKPGFNPAVYKISGENPEISFKTGMLIGRSFVFDSKDNNDGTYTLTCNRINDDSIGLAFPNNPYNAKAGDEYVFLGIELPDKYIQDAENRLLHAGLAYLANHDHTKNVYTPELDNIFLARKENEETRKGLRAGATFWFTDEDINGKNGDVVNTIKLPISKLTLKIGSSLIREYEITLADTPDIDSDIVQRTINEIQGSIGVSGGNGVNEGAVKNIGDKRYIRKDIDDTAKGLITFLKGLRVGGTSSITAEGVATFLQLVIGENYGISQDGLARLSAIIANSLKSTNFKSGDLTGTGFGVWTDANGISHMEVDSLLVRQIATFLKLEIRELSYVNGNIVLGKSGSKLSNVETLTEADGTVTGWKCFFTADDGTTATTNSWKAGDQARCQTFDIKPGVYQNVSNKFYWRLVTEVGDGYIVLSATDKSEATDNAKPACCPAKGDTVVQVGYRLGYNATEKDPADSQNKERTNLIMLSTSGTDSAVPSIEMYANVHYYTLDPKQKEGPTTIVSMSPDGIIFNAEKLVWTDGTINWKIPVPKGDWEANLAPYNYYDQVYHDGCTWLCINPNGSSEEPSKDSADWQITAGIPADYEMKLDLGGFEYSGLAVGETMNVTCYVMKGGQNRTGDVTQWAVTRASQSTDDDAVWNAAHKNFSGKIGIGYGDLGMQGRVTSFTFTAWMGTTKQASFLLEI